MFLNSNEQFLVRKNTYKRFAILTVVFMKKRVFWGVTIYALIYRCESLSAVSNTKITDVHF